MMIITYFLVSTFATIKAIQYSECSITLSDNLKAVVCSQNGDKDIDTIGKIPTAELYATSYVNHIETHIELNKQLITKLRRALTVCSANLNSVCNLKIPRDISLVKFHLSESIDGSLNVVGVYMRQVNDNNNKNLKLAFRINKRKKISKRFAVVIPKQSSNFANKPSNIFKRLYTTPKGLVVIGIIKATKKPKPVTKSLGIITSAPRQNDPKNVKKLMLHTSKYQNGNLSMLVKELSSGFDMVTAEL